ncbi:MAG: hypothetical protein HEP71_24475 [Roseivirga sp.]|nr:hypothetical protein [Roseivirga sp.]
MKYTLILIIFTLPLLLSAQKISTEEVTELYLLALEDFESSPLKLHKMDSKILIDKPDCENSDLPIKIGNSVVEWFCFDQELTTQLEGKLKKHNGRSVILTSHRQPHPDTITVRVDQWTLGNIGNGTRFIPINEDNHPEYRIKNHDYVFLRINTNWKLIEKANTLKSPTEKAKEIEEIFQKGNSLSREGKYKEALEHVERSMAMDSNLYQRYSFRADLKAKLGMYESAISDMSTCIERCNCTYRESHISSYLIKRASFHEQNEDFESALKDANESLLYNSKSWQSYLYRGQLLAKSQQFEEALDDLNKSAQLNDNRPEIFITRGLIHAKLGNMENACSDFKIVKDWGYEEAKQWMKENCK